MQELCFQKKDSARPLCGVHNAPLAQYQIAIDPNAPVLGIVTCYVCAISHAVVQERERLYVRKAN